ncbi:MAG: ABC transporter permease [Schwartzia sp.]|nr:ABC transporter permease [Schwartzia sp. (in: firmicutes)]
MRKYHALIPFVILASLLLVVALFAPAIAPLDPYAQDLSVALLPPDDTYLLGTDRYGRDVLSRVIVGSRTTLGASLALLIVISVGGTLIGAVAGYRGGKIDTALMRLSDVALAFPAMVFAIAVAGVLGGGLVSAAVAIALISWPKYARLARGLVLQMRSMPYLAAARFAGRSETEILIYHVMPNIAAPIIVTATAHLGTLIMEMAGLSFLGLGAMPPTAEWGAMMNNGRSLLQTSPWVILSPGIAIFIAVSIFNMLGDKLRDVFDTHLNE